MKHLLVQCTRIDYVIMFEINWTVFDFCSSLTFRNNVFMLYDKKTVISVSGVHCIDSCYSTDWQGCYPISQKYICVLSMSGSARTAKQVLGNGNLFKLHKQFELSNTFFRCSESKFLYLSPFFVVTVTAFFYCWVRLQRVHSVLYQLYMFACILL